MNLFKSFVERFLRIVIVPKSKSAYVVSGDFSEINDNSGRLHTGSVIVGALKNPRQLSVCIKNNFYHIPKSVAGDEGRRVDYVAIYQSRNLFDRMAGIEFYGKVKKISLVPRYRIKEIAKYSDDLYYRYDVEKWIKLDKRIVPDGEGIICEYTTIDKLKKAKDVSELFDNKG